MRLLPSAVPDVQCVGNSVGAALDLLTFHHRYLIGVELCCDGGQQAACSATIKVGSP